MIIDNDQKQSTRAPSLIQKVPALLLSKIRAQVAADARLTVLGITSCRCLDHARNRAYGVFKPQVFVL